jgi:hypothetical protein
VLLKIVEDAAVIILQIVFATYAFMAHLQQLCAMPYTALTHQHCAGLFQCHEQSAHNCAVPLFQSEMYAYTQMRCSLIPGTSHPFWPSSTPAQRRADRQIFTILTGSLHVEMIRKTMTITAMYSQRSEAFGRQPFVLQHFFHAYAHLALMLAPPFHSLMYVS